MPIHCDRIIQAGKFLIKSDKIKDESQGCNKNRITKIEPQKVFLEKSDSYEFCREDKRWN